MGAHRRDRDGRIPQRTVEIFIGSLCGISVLGMAVAMVWIIIDYPQNAWLVVLLVLCLGLFVPKLMWDSMKIILGR